MADWGHTLTQAPQRVHSSLAWVLYHVISADKHVDTREKHEFARILKQEFDLDDDQVAHLYAAAKSSSADVHGDLHTLNFYLKHNPAVRMTFMRKLLHRGYRSAVHRVRAGSVRLPGCR